MITGRSLKTLIEVDGGVNSGNIKALIEAGTDVFRDRKFHFLSRRPVRHDPSV